MIRIIRTFKVSFDLISQQKGWQKYSWTAVGREMRKDWRHGPSNVIMILYSIYISARAVWPKSRNSLIRPTQTPSLYVKLYSPRNWASLPHFPKVRFTHGIDHRFTEVRESKLPVQFYATNLWDSFWAYLLSGLHTLPADLSRLEGRLLIQRCRVHPSLWGTTLITWGSGRDCEELYWQSGRRTRICHPWRLVIRGPK